MCGNHLALLRERRGLHAHVEALAARTTLEAKTEAMFVVLQGTCREHFCVGVSARLSDSVLELVLCCSCRSGHSPRHTWNGGCSGEKFFGCGSGVGVDA